MNSSSTTTRSPGIRRSSRPRPRRWNWPLPPARSAIRWRSSRWRTSRWHTTPAIPAGSRSRPPAIWQTESRPARRRAAFPRTGQNGSTVHSKRAPPGALFFHRQFVCYSLVFPASRDAFPPRPPRPFPGGFPPRMAIERSVCSQ